MVRSSAGHRGFAKIKMLSEEEILLQGDGGKGENHTQSVLAHVHYQGRHYEESKATLESGHMIWLPVLRLQWTGMGCELDGIIKTSPFGQFNCCRLPFFLSARNNYPSSSSSSTKSPALSPFLLSAYCGVAIMFRQLRSNGEGW